MKTYMLLNGLRWSRNSGSILCNTLKKWCFRTAWGEGRQGMHVHGGRDQKNLWNTLGCIRIADDDIAELKQLTDM